MHSELAVSLATDTERWLGIVLAHATATFVHAGRGHFDLAESHAQRADDFVAFVPTPTGQCFATVARAVLAQARGEPDELRSATAPLLDGRIPPSAELDRWGWQVLAIEGLLGTGELDAARERLAEFADLVEAHGLWLAGADVAR